MTNHPLLTRLAHLRRKARRLLLLHALAWVVGVAIASTLVLGLADYATRLNDVGLRWLAWLALVIAVGWAFWRHLRPALLTRLDDLYLAQRIERRFPLLANALASTIEFLHQTGDDAQAGSAALRRTVVQETKVQVERLDFNQALDRRQTRLALLASGWIVFLAAFLAWLDDGSARIAVSRLLLPWQQTAWPKQHHLFVRNPVLRVPLGQPFEIEVVDAQGADYPTDATIHYRFAGSGGPDARRSEALQRVGDLLVAKIAAVERPFSYRVTGGDDDTMPWHDLEVVEPPKVGELTITLHYPDYTGWPPTESDPHIRALVGTRVAMTGKTTKLIKSATIEVENGDPLAATVSENGEAFTLPADAERPLVIKGSGAYRIDLEDNEGFHGHRDVRYDLRAIEDRPPTISLEQPAADGFVTPDAVVPVRILAKDDLALSRVELGYLRSDQSDKGIVNLTLWQGPAKPQAPDRLPGAAGPVVPQGDSRVVEHALELTPLKLAPSTQLTVHATAVDYQPLSTTSHARRLTVISAAELQERLAERQSLLLGELSRVLKLQRDARAQLGNVEIQLNKVDHVGKSDVDHLQQAELLQRQVERTLTSKADGLPAQIAGLLADLRNNRVAQGDTPEQMQRLLGELSRLAEEALPGASRELVAAIKEMQSRLSDADGKNSQPIPAEASVRRNLSTAGDHQDEIIESLEQLAGELNQWDTYRRFHREIGQLRRDQESLARDTAETGAKTLTKPLKDLNKQETADLEKLAARQNDLARQLEKTQQRMGELADKLRQADPVAADTVQDALHHARQQNTSGKLREAGQNIEQNQIGQAAGQQQQAARELEQMLDILSNRRENELGRLVKKLREAEQQLDQLREQQAGLRKKFAEAERNPDETQRRRELERLTRQQRELQQQADRFARQLQRLQADQASRAATRGSGKMGQAGQQAEQGDAQGAGKQADEAVKDLEEAAQQLAQRRRKAEADLANEQASQIQDIVRGLVQQQERLLTETRHYDQQQSTQGRLTRAQSQSVQDLSRQQFTLADETSGLGKKLTAEVFRLALEGAAKDMTGAGRRLAERDVTAPTQRLQQLALNRARRLLDAFKNDDQEKQDDAKQQPGDSGGEGKPGQGGPTVSIAELKLIKLLQEDLNERTRSLEEEVGRTKNVTPELAREYGDLSDEQGRLAELLIKLTTPTEPAKPDSGDLNELIEKDLKADDKPRKVNND